MSGVIRFSWLEANGDITNWWSGGLSRKRFVHTQWGHFAVAVDLERREAQLLFEQPAERIVIKFAELKGDSNEHLAFEAVYETGEYPLLATELLLRAIGRDDLADRLTATGRPA